jgi:prefoldin subunit 5
MSTPSSSASHQKLQDLVAAADSLKRQMSEIQALREEVAKAERTYQMAKQRSAVYEAILKSSTFLPSRR